MRFRTSLFRDSYFNRIVLLWNNLPITTRQSSSFNVFKEKLYTYFCKLDSDFDPDRVRVTPSQSFCVTLDCVTSLIGFRAI